MERVLSLQTNIFTEAWSRMGSLMALVVMKISKHMSSMRAVSKKVKEMDLAKNQIMSLDSICRSMKVSGKPTSNMEKAKLRSRNPTMIKYSILKEYGLKTNSLKLFLTSLAPKKRLKASIRIGLAK